MLDGVTEMVGGGLGVPTPARVIVAVGVDGSLVENESVPEAEPVVVGAKVTGMKLLPPAGTCSEEIGVLKPGPAVVMLVIVKSTGPAFTWPDPK